MLRQLWESIQGKIQYLAGSPARFTLESGRLVTKTTKTEPEALSDVLSIECSGTDSTLRQSIKRLREEPTNAVLGTDVVAAVALTGNCFNLSNTRNWLHGRQHSQGRRYCEDVRMERYVHGHHVPVVVDCRWSLPMALAPDSWPPACPSQSARLLPRISTKASAGQGPDSGMRHQSLVWLLR
jgi:hypothetical protein